MELIDKTGELSSIKDIEEAIQVVGEIMVKHSLVLPLFTMNSGNIRRCLQEYLAVRKKLEELRKAVP